MGMPRPAVRGDAVPAGHASDCPRRYRFTYLDRPTPPKGPPWAHNTLGAAVHMALRAGGCCRPAAAHAGRRPAAARAGLVSPTGSATPQQSERWRARAADWVGRTCGRVGGLDPSDEPVGVERTVAARTDRLALSGRVDRIDERGRRAGHRRLQDRPGGLTPTTPAARWRWRCTRWPPSARCAGPAAGSSCTTCRPARSPRSSTPRRRWPGTCAGPRTPPPTSIGGDRGAGRRRRSGRGVPAEPRAACSWCDFRRSCPAGQAASAAKVSWAGLGTLTAEQA